MSSLSKRDQCDIAILGGGLAGSLAAIHLARAGFHVIVFEKDLAFSSRVCGEFLSYEALPLLREVGVDPLALGGVEITDFRLHGPTSSADLRLPRRAIGISRGVLDEEMLRVAAAAGAEVRRGVRVTDAAEDGDTFVVSCVGGEEVRASRLVVATGKSEFASLNAREGRDESYVGFACHVRLKPSCASRLAGHCDLFAFEGGYGGLTSLGGGVAEFAFLIERARLRSVGSSWDALTSWIGRGNWAASHYLDGAVPVGELSSVGSIPYGFLRRAPALPGCFFVGDQMAVIPSLTGEGMSIALMTARRAVDCIVEREGRLRFAPEASRGYERSVRSVLRSQIDAALTLHALFKNPRLVDVAVHVLRLVPGLFTRAFRSTRCRIFANSTNAGLAAWQKPSDRASTLTPKSSPVLQNPAP